MKPNLVVALVLGAALAGCAGQHATESDYVPVQGGPGYGASGANRVPGDRPAAQGGSGAGTTGSGRAGAYDTGGGGSTAAEGGSGAGMTGSGRAGGYSASEGGNTSQQLGSGVGAVGGVSGLQAMCALQKRLDAARSEQERQAIINEALPGMTPDLRQQHLEMLRQECR